MRGARCAKLTNSVRYGNADQRKQNAISALTIIIATACCFATHYENWTYHNEATQKIKVVCKRSTLNPRAAGAFSRELERFI